MLVHQRVNDFEICFVSHVSNQARCLLGDLLKFHIPLESPGIARWQPPRRCRCWASRGSWLRPVGLWGLMDTDTAFSGFWGFPGFLKKENCGLFEKRNLTECVSGYKRALVVNGEDHPFFFPALDSCMTPWSRNLHVHRISVTKDGERGLLLHRSRFRSSTCDRLWEVHRVTTVWPPCDHHVTTVWPPCDHRVTMVLDGELESFLLVLNSWIGILQCLQYHILLTCSRSQQLQDSQVFNKDGIHLKP